MRASHNDLLSVQKAIEIERWLVLVDVQDNDVSCFLLVVAGEHSPFSFDGGNHFRFDWGSSSDNCCCIPVFRPSTRQSIHVDGAISLVWSNGDEAVSAFKSMSSARPVIPVTVVAVRSSQEMLSCHGRDGKWLMSGRCWSSGGRRVESSLFFRRKLQQFWRCWGISAARITRLGWSPVLHNAFSLDFRIKRLLHLR